MDLDVHASYQLIVNLLADFVVDDIGVHASDVIQCELHQGVLLVLVEDVGIGCWLLGRSRLVSFSIISGIGVIGLIYYRTAIALISFVATLQQRVLVDGTILVFGWLQRRTHHRTHSHVALLR